tara:strand:- start:228 stop:623 length:396 start_codon:yes stop_codon:yes gene_type:complete
MKTVHYPNVASDQGLIWYYRNFNERTLFGHSGGDLGSATDMFISFSNNVGVVILSNSSHGGMAQIGNAVFEYAESTEFISTGDLNSDDFINDEDIDILINLILAREYIFMADLNLDNKLDIFDLLHMIESF